MIIMSMRTFNGKPFTSEDIKSYVGFVYLITELDTNKKYIGRKYFYQLRKTKGKSKRVRSESDWKKYYGSSKELLEQIKTKEKIIKRIKGKFCLYIRLKVM